MASALFRRSILIVALTVLALGNTGCGKPKVAGKYTSDNGVMAIEFKDGKATVSLGTSSVACDYKEDGNTITVTMDKQSTVFTRGEDGSLTNSEMGTFKKKD